MEFLLDNPLATMEGTYFLILYAFVIFFTVTTLAYFKDRLDTSDKLNIPAIPPTVDPFETAYLRGGPNELARTVIFSLRQKGFIVIANGEKVAYLRPTEGWSANVSGVERTVLGWIGIEREVKEIFSGRSSLVEAIQRWSDLYHHQLEQRQLLMPAEWITRIQKWRLASVALIVGLGGYKIVAAIVTGHFNVIFTILILTGGLIAAMIVGRNTRRTKLGGLYLDRLRTAFASIKFAASTPPLADVSDARAAGFAFVDPLLVSVGVFGTAALASSIYPDYNEAFRKTQQDASGTGGGGGCGGGCGSASCGSGCSSGSSSCGSGCGGCGGGCGG